MNFEPRGWVLSVHMVLLTLQWLRSFWCHSVHFRFLKKPVSRKWLVVERNGMKFGPRGWSFSVYRLLLTLKSHSGVIGCISDFRQSCILKKAARRVKGREIWASGMSIQCIQDTCEVNFRKNRKCTKPWILQGQS